MRRSLAGSLLVIVSGLVLAGASTGTWLREDRTVGGVPVTETVPGVDIAGSLLPLALLAAVGGVLLIFSPRKVGRFVAVGTGLAAVAAGLVTVVASIGVVGRPGSVTGAPALAGAATVGIVVGAVLAGRGRRARLGPRYRLEPPDGPDEWHDTEAEEES